MITLEYHLALEQVDLKKYTHDPTVEGWKQELYLVIFSVKIIVLCLGASFIFTLLKNKEMLSPSANFDIQIVSNNNLYDLVETPSIGSIY